MDAHEVELQTEVDAAWQGRIAAQQDGLDPKTPVPIECCDPVRVRVAQAGAVDRGILQAVPADTVADLAVGLKAVAGEVVAQGTGPFPHVEPGCDARVFVRGGLCQIQRNAAVQVPQSVFTRQRLADVKADGSEGGPCLFDVPAGFDDPG